MLGEVDLIPVPRRQVTPALTMSVGIHLMALLGLMLLVKTSLSPTRDVLTPLDESIVWLPDMRPPALGGGSPASSPTVRVPQPVAAPTPEPIPTVEPTAILPDTEPLPTASAIAAPAAPVDGGARAGGIGDGPGQGPGPGSGPGGDGPVYGVGNGVTAPIATFSPAPAYTGAAMRARLHGEVELTCVVRPEGVCSDIAVTRSLDAVMGLDQEAISVVKRWRFRPGTKDGQPVPVRVRLILEFNIR